jgi:hypothetical protein
MYFSQPSSDVSVACKHITAYMLAIMLAANKNRVKNHLVYLKLIIIVLLLLRWGGVDLLLYRTIEKLCLATPMFYFVKFATEING